MKRTFLIIVLLVLMLSACAPRLASAPSPDVYYGMGGGGADQAYPEERMLLPEAPMAEPAPEFDGSYNSTVANAAAGLPDVQERIVIQNADLAIVVKDPEAKMAEIIQLANSLGGFVVSSNTYQSYAPNGKQVPETSVVVRVPAENLDEVLTKIKADAVEIQSENRSGQDVTSEYVDLSSRLKNHEQAAEQLSQILTQKTESSEVLEVFNQLTYHREQIELIKGQMKYYEEAAALSAVSVRLIAEETIQPLEIGGWKPQGVARDAIQNLIDFLKGFVEFLINFFLYYLWVILLSLLPFYLVFLGIRAVVRRVRKSRKSKLTQTEE